MAAYRPNLAKPKLARKCEANKRIDSKNIAAAIAVNDVQRCWQIGKSTRTHMCLDLCQHTPTTTRVNNCGEQANNKKGNKSKLTNKSSKK